MTTAREDAERIGRTWFDETYRSMIVAEIESALLAERRRAIEEAAKTVADRAAQYAARQDVIFNGKIMYDELKANERRIRSLSPSSPRGDNP